jgi:transposase-like protein
MKTMKTNIIKVICPHCNREGKQTIEIKYKTERNEVFFCKDCNKEFQAIVREIINITQVILSKDITKQE